MSVTGSWTPITGLSTNAIDTYRDRELEFLFEIWSEERLRMDAAGIQQFSARLAREWAIETGIIEGVYTLERGITTTLIEQGIDSSFIPHDSTDGDPELVARIIQAHGDVLEGLVAFIRTERSLSVSYIKEMHAALLRYTDTVVVFDQFGNRIDSRLEKGTYKVHPNNPQRPDGSIHEYCPPEHVASEMDRLIELHAEHTASGVSPIVEAAWLHHAFTQIHPFQDGNGRVARAIASLILIRAGLFPLTVHRDDRTKYIIALEAADEGKLADLVALFARIEKHFLMRAISAAADLRPVSSLEDALAVTRDTLVGPGKIVPKEYLTAKAVASALEQIAFERLRQAAESLSSEITTVNSEYTFGTFDEAGLSPAFRSVVHALKYDPNPEYYHRSFSLMLNFAGQVSKIWLSFHGIGPAFRGLLVAVAYFEQPAGVGLPLSDDVFRINHREPRDQAVNRFIPWLDSCLIQALALWRQSLI